MRVLITGADGFVGRHFQSWFAHHSPMDTVLCIDVKSNMDCRTFFWSSDTRFDLVIHLAAIVGGRATIEGQPLSVAVDLAIDAEMFQWALRTRPGRIVYYSSSAAYPVAYQETPYRLHEDDIDFDNIRSPDMTYGWAKLTGEYLASFAEAEGLRVHVFRPFSGYGEDQDLDYPFPSFVHRAQTGLVPFEVWGDGTQVRDWIHVDDVVAATMEAVKQGVPGPTNLGWGRPTSFTELAQMMVGDVPIAYRLDKPTGVSYRCSDNTKMLSFYPPKISLEEGIRKALYDQVYSSNA